MVKIKLSKILFMISISLWVLPSGSIGRFPIKAFFYLLTIAIMFLEILGGFSKRKLTKKEVFILFPVFNIILWILLGIKNGYMDGVKTELASFVSLILIVMIVSIYIRCFSSAAEIKQVRNLLYFTVLLFIGFKIIIEILYILKILDFNACSYIFRQLLNSQTMMHVHKVGNLKLCRFNTSNDTIPLILFSFDLICEDRSKLTRFLSICLFSFYTIIVYSRVVIVQFLLILLIYAYAEIKKKNIWSIILVFCILVVCIIAIIYNGEIFIPESIRDIYTTRFTGTWVEYSDGIRIEQMKYLVRGISQHPILGNGFGSYVRNYIRSIPNPASYELEYLSFVYQFGILGFMLIIISLICIFYSQSAGILRYSWPKLVVLFNFSIWAVKPLFNPQFISSASGMVISVLIILSNYYYLKQKKLIMS